MTTQNESIDKTVPIPFLSQGWLPFLAEEFKKSYMDNIRTLLKSELKNSHQVFPPKDKIFRALKLVDFNQVKVVILGQDPYHGAFQANGLAFAVENEVPNPPSLINIFKEITNDVKNYITDSTLEHWAKQGVLLLNTVLTVRENVAFSHRGRGWENFTDNVILSLNKKESPVVFLLWGAAAQSKANLIKNPTHKILNAPHPSPLSAYRGFFGCKHFSKTNKLLKENNLTEIQW